MKANLQQVLSTAAGVLAAGTYVAFVRSVGIEMDWATLAVGACLLFGIVYVLGKPA